LIEQIRNSRTKKQAINDDMGFHTAYNKYEKREDYQPYPAKQAKPPTNNNN